MHKDTHFIIVGNNLMINSILTEMLYDIGCEQILMFDPVQLSQFTYEGICKILSIKMPDYVVVNVAIEPAYHADVKIPEETYLNMAAPMMTWFKAAYDMGVPKIIFICNQYTNPEEALKQYMTRNHINSAYPDSQTRKSHVVFVRTCSVYGELDDYYTDGMYFLPGIMMDMHEQRGDIHAAVRVNPKSIMASEYIHEEDLGRALLLLMELYDGDEEVQIGTGIYYDYLSLANEVAKAIGYKGSLIEVMPEESIIHLPLLNSNLIRTLGWEPQISLQEGLSSIYWNTVFVNNY
jgi:GDP-L-fucose synthase